MYTQVIILGNRYFCVVFKLRADGPQIIDMYSSEVVADLREWLAGNDYPMKGEILRERQGANLPHAHFIKPYMTERYFRVHGDKQIEELNPDQFDAPLFAYDGF